MRAPKPLSRLFLALLVLAVSGVSAPGAALQTRFMLKGFDGLTDADVNLMRKTARVDLTGRDVGTVLTWENAASGNKGRVKLEDRFERDGRECLKVLHGIEFKDGSRKTLRLSICRTDEGWTAIE